jgi:2',3'-cyclic-nucleotide 2'-phosphodiesterase/3'-nucleotidase
MADGSGERVHLRLLSTTDLHGHLLPWDYYEARPAPATGLAQAGALIRRLRAEGEARGAAVLLLDNGDMLTGSLLADPLADGPGGGRDGEPPPVVAAMAALGYDAAALGNHDLDRGLGALRAAFGGAPFPVLCVNLSDGAGAPVGAPGAILARETRDEAGRARALRIGLLGVLPPQTAAWAGLASGRGLRAGDMVEAARAEAARLRQAGADLVIGLCHTGIGPEEARPGMENAALPLAATAGLDALVLGHSHRVFPGPGWEGRKGIDAEAGTLRGRPAVQPGFHGSHVGVIDLALAPDAGGWRVAGHAVRAEPVPPALPSDPAVEAVARPRHGRLLGRLDRVVGRTAVPLSSHFALVRPDPVLALVAEAQREAALSLLAGRPEAGLPLLSAAAPFRTGGRGGPLNYVDIAPGPVRLREAAGLYIHPNTLCVVEATGAALRAWLERAASVFCRLVPGATDQPLIDRSFPAWQFDAIHGLSWRIDLSCGGAVDAEGRAREGGGGRIRDLRHEGRPVAASDRVLVATNSHRAAALGEGTRLVLAAPVAIRDLVAGRLGRVPAGGEPRADWGFAPLPGTTAWFDSGPGALAHLPAGETDRIVPLGPAPGGFHRFALRL